MNSSYKLIVGLLFGSALMAPLQVAQSAVAYTNSLKDGAKVVADFTDYSTINSDYIDTLSGGWFGVDSNNGLTLLSVAPNYEDGIAAYNRVLTASNNWTITVQTHLTQFTNTQTNPFYTVGMSLVKTSATGLEYPNRLDLNLTRSGAIGNSMTNCIVSGLYVNNGETDSITNRNIADAYLQFRYTASNRSVVTAYGTNGSNYFPIQTYNLTKLWGMKTSDGLTLGLAANDQPEGRVVPTYSVTPGQIYLKNLTISSPTAPSNAAAGGSASGGTLGGSVSFAGNNTSGSGVTTVNTGGLNTSFGGSTVTFGNIFYPDNGSPLTAVYTNVGGTWVVNTNATHPPGTNVVNGGGSVNGGTNSITVTNQPGIGTSTNAIGGTNVVNGGGSLNGGTNSISLSNPPAFGTMTNSNSVPGLPGTMGGLPLGGGIIR